MPRIVVNAHDGGTKDVVEADQGVSVMRAVVDGGVRGLLADCGGNLSCATCHAYVAEDWLGRIEPPSDMEQAMLECAIDVRPNSRLTCQIILAADLDGMEITMPESQV